MGTQMASGFVPKPKSLVQVTGAWIDGEPVTGITEKNDVGFWAAKGAVKYNSIEAEAMASEFGITIKLADSIYPGSKIFHDIRLDGYSGYTGVGRFYPDDVVGVDAVVAPFTPIWIDGAKVSILTCSYNETLGLHEFTTDANSIGSVDADTIIPIGIASDDFFVGYEVNINGTTIGIGSSSYIKPTSKTFPAASFSCERDMPGLSLIGYKSCILVKSNIIIEGYRSLVRPSRMTDIMDAPSSTKELFAAFMRWKAEEDMEPGGKEASNQEAAFSKLLHDYAVDQSRTDGASMPHFYNFTPRLKNGSF